MKKCISCKKSMSKGIITDLVELIFPLDGELPNCLNCQIEIVNAWRDSNIKLWDRKMELVTKEKPNG